MKNFEKYERSYFMPPVECYDWVKKDYIDRPPVWCSVDLRDGNQALIEPMSLEEKVEFFQLLVDVGFKEIEVGFPAASETEYQFMRTLIEKNMIPDDVTVQVLTQAREHIIKRTFEAVKGAPHAIIHVYNSTSVAQREQVFKKDKAEIKQIAVEGAKLLKELAEETEGNFTFEYSPESFSGTEMEYAMEVCNAVLDVWQPSADNKAIINLPATVENALPHVFASQVEYFHKYMSHRENTIISLHPHNDRGTGVATAELALLAGAERVEGTLFGNGERTGNVDVLNIAYNMFSQGIDPQLAIEHVNESIEIYERCCKIPVHPRHPYAGKLVFTAFSGSHQDAINKGVKAMKERGGEYWEVPYLPIDPADIGREYEPIVRINSQSGKGGVAFIMDTYFGFKLPKGMHREFANVIQAISEKQGEVSPDQIMESFREEYLMKKEPIHFRKLKVDDLSDETESEFDTKVTVVYTDVGVEKSFEAVGNGPIDAVKRGLQEELNISIKILDYEEHALQSGSNSQAAAYIHLLDVETGGVTYGVGVSSNITRASVRAIFSAVNRLNLIKRG